MDGGILSILVNGKSPVPVKHYYAYPATSNSIGLYSDIKCTIKVTDPEITIMDSICIFETPPIQADIVYYGSNLFECMISNNDLVFDFNKWKKLKLTDYRISAAERIKYATGLDDISAYMMGASYEGLTLRGPHYDSSTTPSQTITSSYDDVIDDTVIDADYSQGYGPEELVPAIISDEMVILVYSSELALSSNDVTHPVQSFSEDLSELQFRIVIDKNGNQHIHRIFLENIETMSTDIGQDDDIVQVGDVLGMLSNESFEAEVQEEASVKFIKLEDFVSPFRGDIKYVKLNNLTTNTAITLFDLQEHTPDYRIVIEEAVATGDIIDVQLYSASEVMIGNERMTLVSVDPVANTIKVARGCLLLENSHIQRAIQSMRLEDDSC
ncbi:hypothetical protein GHT06_001881 [Daphnia sinensis]|uniref:Uncharacterized protein n=1 Tax=Daphnia sinensis TaxID=1820382 RepID=A0AAD5PJW3_9CRUS|nr:hypothetical protein GHT06_001881 [Daphnia sinensis]